MDVVFNSLFDSELDPEDSLYYPTTKHDTTLLLSNLVFQEDEEMDLEYEDVLKYDVTYGE